MTAQMLLSQSQSMSRTVLTFSPTSHNPQFFSHHKTTQLNVFTPRNQKLKFPYVYALKIPDVNVLGKSSYGKSGSFNSQLVSHQTMQLDSFRPRSQKQKFLS
ncbi:unnamed protein product [Ilex paraguariensis]|uniref:Uncharacterized protein n=1 Tax=Ilex paraguariensis TaxID=185542 RepID=A0ABC8UUU2_9AQUA